MGEGDIEKDCGMESEISEERDVEGLRGRERESKKESEEGMEGERETE